MGTRFERFESNNEIHHDGLARLEIKAAELEHKFSEWRDWLDHELGSHGSDHWQEAEEPAEDETSLIDTPVPETPAAQTPGEHTRDRTSTIIARGRRTADHARRSRRRKMAIGAAAAVAVIVAISTLLLVQGSPSWPASVAVVQQEIDRACQNPNVASEPSQVNFACAKSTSQILWVFSLISSDNNPKFSDGQTGRKGLEPITPTQGGAIAWSLNLHHPYNPYDPIDSLQVAARAINNIIGGATLTGANGSPQVQPGLESDPANCARYTGSAAVVSRAGYPSMCAMPVTSSAGQAALVSDIYQKWFVGAGAVTAQNAAVLFENAGNPGNAQVQAILKTLPGS
jgi:hypothetical protein